MASKQEKALLAQLQALLQQQAQQANTPDPNIQRLLGLNNSIIDWHTNPGNTVKDIYKHPTLGSKLPTFQMAKKNMDAGRIGRGVVGRTDLNNDQYSADKKMEDDFERSIAASGALETGLQQELDGAQNNIGQLSSLEFGRKQGIINGMGALYGISKDLAARVSQGGWGGFFRGLAGGVLGAI